MNQRLTKVDWSIIVAALVYHEAASYGAEEMGDEAPQNFPSWGAYYKRASQTIQKAMAMRDQVAA